MKVLYLITKSTWGGAATYVYDLATNVPANWESVVVAGGKPDGELFKKIKDFNDKTPNELPVQTLHLRGSERDISLFRDALVLWRLFRIVWTERPDVLHVNSAKGGGLGAFVGRALFVRKVVFTAHGWSFKETHRPWLWQRLAHFFSWLTSFFAHITITITDGDYESGQAFPLIAYKMRKVYLGIRDIDFLPRDEARKELCNISNKKRPKGSPWQSGENAGGIWIGSIAELHKNKGLEYGLRALAQLKRSPFQYYIISDGEERQTLEGLMAKLEIEDRVHLLAAVVDAKRYLKAFDIFLLPSLKEGLPYTILESGYASLPVVSSNVGGIPDICESGESGLLCEPRDVNCLTESLASILNDPNERKRLGTALHREITTKFNFDKMLDETFILYT